ncbi:T9SS C-terminal target domain-containing protein [candidate division KSB1 bacterium]|nr:pre-peptidase C-terminal domain-containing protein [candidate division KSB1 bacterium]RQW04803.1 MAG: T9SS C-terminal target domain-containing protein [candidate division KSB1 bacterium]
MKFKTTAMTSFLVILTLFVGLFSVVADTISSQKADLPRTLEEAYETPAITGADRAERFQAIRSAMLDAKMDIKAEDPAQVYERHAAFEEKQADYEIEQKYSAEKEAIIANFMKKDGGTVLTRAAAGMEADEFEPDNSHNQGEKLVDGFVSVKHNVYPAGDVDFFWFSANAGDIIEIVTVTPNPFWSSKDDPYQLLPPSEADLDPFVTLYLPNRNVLAQDDDSGTGWDAYVNIQVPESGIYYISVESSPYWAPPTVGSYEIGLRFLSADGFEPDDTEPQAHTLTDGTVRTGHTIMPAGDVDFYKFDVTVPGTALHGLVVAGPSAHNGDWDKTFLPYMGDLDPCVTIFDAAMVPLYTMDDTYNPYNAELGLFDVELMYSFPIPGTYYAKVYASPYATAYNTQVGSYDITFDLTLPDAYEPDNLPGAANGIAYGQTIDDHTITSVLDGDFFKFTGAKGDYIRVLVDSDKPCGDLDPGVALFAEGGVVGNGTWGQGDLDWLHSSMDDGVGLNARIVWGPLPKNGTYYLEVGADPLSWYNWWERSGSYSISLEKIGHKSSFPNNKNKAIPINIGETLSGIIPRTGEVWPDDEDVTTLPWWFKFEGEEGQTIAATVMTPVQYRSGCGTMQSDWMDDLNPMVTLIGPSGKLAVNKNINPMNEWDDARVVYTLPEDGLYYLKVQAEIVEEGPLFEFFGDADSYGAFDCRLVGIPAVVDFDSDRNLGHSPVFVNYFDHCQIADDPWAEEFIWDASWSMGLMMYGKEPYYCYWQPRHLGFHDVMKKASNAAGSVMEIKEDFIEMYLPNGYAPLEFIDGIGDYPHEPWAAAVDADDYCWTGVATVREETPGVYPWATFNFADGKTKMVTKLRLKADAGMGNVGRWVRKVRISSNALTPTDPYTPVVESLIVGGGWNEFELSPAVQVTNLKLEVMDSDLDSLAGWRQISEFEAYEDIVVPDMEQSLLTVTTPHLADGKDEAQITVKLVDDLGNPITIYDEQDVHFYMTDCQPGMFGPLDLTDAANGVYKTTLKTTNPGTYQIFAVAHGAIILNDKPGDNESGSFVSFFGNAGQKGELVLVEGSETSKGEGWDNAIDGDREGWDGTVTTKGDPLYAIFQFSNNAKMPVNKIGLATDNGFDDDVYEGRQVRQFKVYVSDDMATWTLILDATRQNGGEMTYYRIDTPQFGKYVKLVITQPTAGWVQLVEFEVLFDSKEGFQAEDADIAAMPETFALDNNYPNPFNPTTTINYQLPEERHVKISVYNVIGQHIVTLVDAQIAAGYHSVVWDAAKQPSGIYLYRIEAGDFIQTNRMVLLK